MWLSLVEKNLETIRKKLNEMYRLAITEWESAKTYHLVINKHGSVRIKKSSDKGKTISTTTSDFDGDVYLYSINSYNIWNYLSDEEINWDIDSFLKADERKLLQDYCEKRGLKYSLVHLKNINKKLYNRVYREWVDDHILTSADVQETVATLEAWILSYAEHLDSIYEEELP